MTSLTGNMGGPAQTGDNLRGNSTGRSQRRYRNFRESRAPKGYDKFSLRQFNPKQIKLLNQGIRRVSPDSYLSRLAGGDESLFEEMEDPAMRQFAGLQGNIASRFSGAGDLGGRRSSGFQNTMTDSASNFAQQLQSNRQGLQRQALEDIMSYSQMLMQQRPFERGYAERPTKPPKQSSAETWGKLGGFIPGLISDPKDPGGATRGALSNLPIIGGFF